MQALATAPGSRTVAPSAPCRGLRCQACSDWRGRTAVAKLRRMRGHSPLLANTTCIEAWPGGLLRARGNHAARVLAGARWVFRRKRDGAFLAAEVRGTLVPLVPGLRHEPGMDAAMAAVRRLPVLARPGIDAVPTLPVHGLQQRLLALGVDREAYEQRSGLALVPEPAWLAMAGRDRYRRPLWLHVDAARAWRRLHDQARRDGIALDAISGYRSHDHQLGIFVRKLARGQDLDRILAVNAAPGYSEHHGGFALDVGTPGEPPAEESFEATAAFAWLRNHAAQFDFVMSYPRDNPHGIVYEPWHWIHRPAASPA